MSHEEARGIQQLKPISEIFYRSSKRCSIKNANFKNFTKFTLCQSHFFNKVADIKPATLFNKRLLHRCFHVKYSKFLRAPFYRTPLDDCFCL